MSAKTHNGQKNANPYRVSAKGDLVPPHNIEAEEALLGSLLINPDAIIEVEEFLKPDHFYRVKNGWIYEAIINLYRNNQPVDTMTVIEGLRQAGHLEEIGGESFIAGLLTVVPMSLNAHEYARTVEKTATRRRMINTARSMAKLAWEEAEELEIQLDQAENMVFDLRGERVGKGVLKPRQYVGTYMDLLEDVAGEERDMVGIPTGFMDLDRLLGGLIAPHLYILAARPGMGKSSMAINIADRLVLKQKKRVALFSLEMSADQIVQRIVSANTGIGTHKLREADLNVSEWPRVYEVLGQLGESYLFIDETGDITPAQLRAKSRRLYAEHGLDLIVVDHMHIMMPDRDLRNPVKEVGEISRSLAHLGKDLNVPVLAVAQLNRAVENRRNKRPMLADLRDSGEIEQNAYAVMFLYRDGYYEGETSDRPNIGEVDVAKHRDGPTGKVDLFWQASTASFRDLARKELAIQEAVWTS